MEPSGKLEVGTKSWKEVGSLSKVESWNTVGTKLEVGILLEVGMKLEVEKKWEVGTKSWKLEQKVGSWNKVGH